MHFYINEPEQGILQMHWGQRQCNSNSHVYHLPVSNSKQAIFSLTIYYTIFSASKQNLKKITASSTLYSEETLTWMWSRTDRAELREIPRSPEGPPQTTPTLRTLPFSFSFTSSPLSITRPPTASAVARGTPTPRHHVIDEAQLIFNRKKLKFWVYSRELRTASVCSARTETRPEPNAIVAIGKRSSSRKR